MNKQEIIPNQLIIETLFLNYTVPGIMVCRGLYNNNESILKNNLKFFPSIRVSLPPLVVNDFFTMRIIKNSKNITASLTSTTPVLLCLLNKIPPTP